MHITHITGDDPQDKDAYSGTLHWIVRSLSDQNDLQFKTWYIPPARQLLPGIDELIFRCKRLWARMYHEASLVPRWYSKRAQHISQSLKKQLANHKTNAILATLNPTTHAFLETKIPIIYWTDWVYAAVANFYPEFRFYDVYTQWDAHFITNACLNKATRLVFSSQWAARNAIDLYGIDKEKIRVVPFGANFEINHHLEDIKNIIKNRSRKCIKFLFVGKNWYRKGGDIVLKIVNELHRNNHPVELTIVGCNPKLKTIPDYVKCLGFLSKNKNDDVDKLKKLYQEAHFLFVPSRAEAYGIVFCEANAFALPCITTYVGGIPDIVKDNINGMKFSLEATVNQYCDYIINLMNHCHDYESLALSSFHEYETRLNWKNASMEVKKIIAEVIT